MSRLTYALLVNLLLGCGGSIALLRHLRSRALVTTQDAGLRPSRRTALAVAAGLLLGGAAYVLQGAPSRDPVVVLNAFAQVFVVSTAEILVCWSLLATTVRGALRPWGRALSAVGASVVASALFAVYHFAHSPPFNTLPMVALLAVVGLVTSTFFFASRDLAGTIVFHNFLGVFGVVQALVRANALQSMTTLQAPLLFTAMLAGAAVAAGYVLLSRNSLSAGHGAS